MPKIPELVEVNLDRSVVLVDGVEFPWPLPVDEPVRVAISPLPGEVQKVTITFLSLAVKVTPASP